jgi:hypothetical protein
VRIPPRSRSRPAVERGDATSRPAANRLEVPACVERRAGDGEGIHVKYVPGTFRPTANKDNDYLIDRLAQKEKRSFSGVEGFSVQDASLQESMGPIQDHSKEHLVATDKPISMARRMLFNAALNLSQGMEPPALDASVQRVRAASVLLDRKINAPEWAKTALLDGLKQPVFTL